MKAKRQSFVFIFKGKMTSQTNVIKDQLFTQPEMSGSTLEQLFAVTTKLDTVVTGSRNVYALSDAIAQQIDATAQQTNASHDTTAQQIDTLFDATAQQTDASHDATAQQTDASHDATAQQTDASHDARVQQTYASVPQKTMGISFTIKKLPDSSNASHDNSDIDARYLWRHPRVLSHNNSAAMSLNKQADHAKQVEIHLITEREAIAQDKDMHAEDECPDNVDSGAVAPLSVPAASLAQQYVPVKRLRQKHMCELCGFRGSKYDLAIHMNKHTNASVHCCHQCDKTYRYRRNLLEHLHNAHSGPSRLLHVCEFCGANYKSKPALLKHLRAKHLGKRTFPCKYCGHEFSNSTELKEHLQLTHVDEQVAAGELIPVRQRSATRQYRTRNDDGTYKYSCPVCLKAFKAGYVLRNHMRTHSNERPYECDRCEKAFKQAAHLMYHKMAHDGKRPHKCGVCGRAFRDRTKLRNHMLKSDHAASNGRSTGRQPKTLLCLLCGRRFSQAAAFKRHLKMHQSGELPVTKSSSHDSNNISANVQIINLDSNVTTNVRIFRKSGDDFHQFVASRIEADSSSVKDVVASVDDLHIRNADGVTAPTHESIPLSKNEIQCKDGIKLYQCPTCSKCFRHGQTLRIHLRVHSAERPYTCDVCSKSFRQLAHLKYHRLAHDDIRPFLCQPCNLSFRSSSKLTQHKHSKKCLKASAEYLSQQQADDDRV